MKKIAVVVLVLLISSAVCSACSVIFFRNGQPVTVPRSLDRCAPADIIATWLADLTTMKKNPD